MGDGARGGAGGESGGSEDGGGHAWGLGGRQVLDWVPVEEEGGVNYLVRAWKWQAPWKCTRRGCACCGRRGFDVYGVRIG